ncbi:MAG: transcription elongation factor GreA [Erysipelotrichaceae bacterium]|nr:transcription elongation factor GreA [Erysipelotrichaceae bacterium]
MADKKIILTQGEREKLEKEYRDLIDVQRPDVIEKLALARSQGDLSENADYDAARDRQAQVEGRISEIEKILNNAVSAEEAGLGGNSKKIGIGDTVTFEEVGSGEKATVRIVGQVGADPFAEPPSISNESPIGLALIGAEPGQSVFVESGERYEIKILSSSRK